MVKTYSEYKFDIFTNYIRNKKNFNLSKMLSHLRRHSNTVVTVEDSLTTNKNNDGLVIFVLKTSQYNNLTVSVGKIIEKGNVANNVSSDVTQTYNNIIKNCGHIPNKNNTKYLVLEQDFYDKNEGKSSLRILHVTVSHVINTNGKSRVLVGFYPEIRESVIDIVNKAIRQENALVLGHPQHTIVNNAKINDALHTVINISAFSSSLLQMYPQLDALSLHEQLKQVIIGFEIKSIKTYKNNTFTNCLTYDIGNYTQINRVKGAPRGHATINNNNIHINTHSYYLRVKTKGDNTPDYIVNIIISGNMSLDYSCNLHKGTFTYKARVWSTEIIEDRSIDNNNMNSKGWGDFINFFSPGSYVASASETPETPPMPAAQVGNCVSGGIAVGMGTDKLDDPCENPNTAGEDSACLIGGFLGDVASSTD